MKQFFLLCVFLIVSFSTRAQLAIIQDPDGYVNLRAKPDIVSEVLMKVTTADVLFCFSEETEGDWYAADATTNEKQRQFGYIHRSRVKFIHDFDSLSVSLLLKDKVVFKNQTIQIEVKTKPFDPKANTIEYSEEGATYRYVKTINQEEVWGIDGNMPKVAYESIKVTINGNKIMVPSYAYRKLFEPTLEYMSVNYDAKKDVLYIHGLNSDGAGAYVFVIIIKNKKFEKSVAMIPF